MDSLEPIYVHGIGLTAPGLADWHTARAVLRGQAGYRPEPLPAYRVRLLPPNEARRAGVAVRLVFQAAEQACADVDAAGLATVFATTAADINITDRICCDLVDPLRAVSPTQFHNSVHNAAAAYWSIATGSREPANSVSGGQDSFTVALAESWAMLTIEADAVLLACFDVQGSGMLDAARPDIHAPCALALLLSRHRQGALARVSGWTRTGQTASTMAPAALECLRRHNPAARGLPLLAALAGSAGARVVLESDRGNVAVTVEPQ